MARSRRRHIEEHQNHEAWAIPYGDFLTLLLAFFVVMYAMSSVNEGKFRILSDSLVAAFRDVPKSLKPVQVGDISRSSHELQTRPERTLVPREVSQPALALLAQEPSLSKLQAAGFSATQLDEAAGLVDEMDKALRGALGQLIDQDLVHIRRDKYWLEIQINTQVLFGSGSASLSSKAQGILQSVGKILATTPLHIYVEGHTDEVPINTRVYPSNWELSAARAARVVRLFATMGANPKHMAALGFGKFHPIADNATAQGRRRNRRVAIVLMADRNRIQGEQMLERIAASSEAGPANTITAPATGPAAASPSGS